jgi:hypothetical protein
MRAGLVVVIGMSMMYLFSVAGMAFAWVHYKKHRKGIPRERGTP